QYLNIPRQDIHVIYPGLNLTGHGLPRSPEEGRPFTIGYFARICPEKGLHILAQAFQILQKSVRPLSCRLRVSGWLGANNAAYFQDIQRRLKDWGLAGQFEHVESPDHGS